MEALDRLYETWKEALRVELNVPSMQPLRIPGKPVVTHTDWSLVCSYLNRDRVNFPNRFWDEASVKSLDEAHGRLLIDPPFKGIDPKTPKYTLGAIVQATKPAPRGSRTQTREATPVSADKWVPRPRGRFIRDGANWSTYCHSGERVFIEPTVVQGWRGWDRLFRRIEQEDRQPSSTTATRN